MKDKKKFPFTNRAIAALPAHDPDSPSKSAEYSDTAMPGLRTGPMEEMGNVCRRLSGPNISRAVGILTRRHHPLSAAAAAMRSALLTRFPPQKADAARV